MIAICGGALPTDQLRQVCSECRVVGWCDALGSSKAAAMLETPSVPNELFEVGVSIVNVASQQCRSGANVSRLAENHKLAVLILRAAATLSAERKLQARIAIGLLQQGGDDSRSAWPFRSRYKQIVQSSVQISPFGGILRV